jgi:hypothetical protein
VKAPLIVSFGAGVNSTAMLCGFAERGIRPDAILFADTGGERPETYRFLDTMDVWLAQNGMPNIIRVRYQVKRKGAEQWGSLEEECLGSGTLPSLAYGWHKCSAKWKVTPQIEWFKEWTLAKEAQQAGVLVQKAIGFRVGEERRRKEHIQDPGTVKIFPLIEWGWDQEDCKKAINRAGLAEPPKSSCFFCPATKRQEIAKMALQEPDLFDRAVRIEQNAKESGNLITVKGLGRSYSWQSIGEAARSQCTLPGFDSTDSPCGCYDGDEDD